MNSSFTGSRLLPILITVFLLFSTTSSFNYQPPYSPRGLLIEDKTRLGSIPPSCHNKCNQCHPCTAVQVPTFSGKKRAVHQAQAQAEAHPMATVFQNDPSPLNKKYTNYKPLGWKCHCNGHFYNPRT